MLVTSSGANSSFQEVLQARKGRFQGLAACASEGVERGFIKLLLPPQSSKVKSVPRKCRLIIITYSHRSQPWELHRFISCLWVIVFFCRIGQCVFVFHSVVFFALGSFIIVILFFWILRCCLVTDTGRQMLGSFTLC